MRHLTQTARHCTLYKDIGTRDNNALYYKKRCVPERVGLLTHSNQGPITTEDKRVHGCQSPQVGECIQVQWR